MMYSSTSSSSSPMRVPKTSTVTDDPEDNQNPMTDTDSEDDEVILSVYWKGGKLGAAVYNIQDPAIYVLNDIFDDFHLGFKILKFLFMQAQPTQVVTCKSMPPQFVDLLHELLTEAKDSNKHVPLHNRIHILRDTEFRGVNSCQQILAFKLTGEPEAWTEEEHKVFIRSLVDFHCESMVHALARLLKYLDQNSSDELVAKKQILAIQNLCLDHVVWVNRETLRALQIFNNLSHPSLFKWTPGVCKEGFSIFGIFNRCRSQLGSKFMRSTLARPISDVQELNKRHEVIGFCMNASNADVIRKMETCIGQVHNVVGILPKLLAGKATLPQWRTFKKTVHHVLLLREICIQYAHLVTFFQQVDTGGMRGLYHTREMINRIIDFQFGDQMKFTVLPGIDAELDNLKQQKADLPRFLRHLVSLEMEDLPEYVTQCSAAYLPEIGFLLCIPQWKDPLTVEEVNIPALEFKFAANGVLHYKSTRCFELDKTIGDIDVLISEKELRVMLGLVKYIQPNIGTLMEALSFVAEMDCLIAMAEVAKENNYVKPIMTEGHEIIIEKGRHPLQECCVNNYVANDIISNEECGFVKILTGPNASGKSVYLKQVAVIAYIAHTGSYIPAQLARIGTLDQIHTIIKVDDSIAIQLSSFKLDLRQMNMSLCHSSKSSLIIVDEFGKGTSEEDGLYLLAACVAELLGRGAGECPHVFVSTHFHRLCDLLPTNPLVMTQVLDHTVRDGELVYLYELRKGAVSSSMTIEVAKASGIPEACVNRAKETSVKVLQALKGGMPIKPLYSHKKIKRSVRQQKLDDELNIDAMSIEELTERLKKA